jgi:hypothetical protein
VAVRWVLCVLVLVNGQAWAGDAPWRTATTPNYRILSQLSDSDTADWMRGFDQFVSSTGTALGMNPRDLSPLTVVIFARGKDFTPYKLAGPSGKTAIVAGQFVWRRTWSMIAMASDAFDDQSRRTIYHEATHWLMSADQASQPAWFSEGIAEMFSTFERVGDKVYWAKPIDAHLKLLATTAPMPLTQFLAEPSALFDRDDRTSLFYAQAWAFTHFLMLSKDQGRRRLLAQFLDTYKTQSGEATVNAVFGKDLPQLEHEFHIYITQRSWRYWRYMIEPAQPDSQPPALQPAAAELVEASLGFLGLASEQPELARQHAQKAIDLDPSAPDGHAILAYLEQRPIDGGENDAGVTEAQAAVQRGSRDAEMFRMLGDSYLNGPNSAKPDAKQASVGMYENAITSSPRQEAYYVRLVNALVALEKPREEDAKFLAIGTRAYPGDDWLRVGSAVVDDRRGHHDAALTELEAALRPDSRLDPLQRDYANQIHSRWLIQTMESEISVAEDNRDYSGARAILSRYRERLVSSAQTDTFLKETDDRLAILDGVTRFDALLHQGKSTAARALAQQLLAIPDLPGPIRLHLTGSLQTRRTSSANRGSLRIGSK